MILGDEAIKQVMLNTGRIKGACEDQVNPASLNIRLGDTFLIPKRSLFGVKLGARVKYRRVQLAQGDSFKLRSGQFALATTIECVKVPDDMAAFVQGRSSIGRAGLTVQNAGFVDPGFFGHITLELKNETRNTILLRPGYPVAQLIFDQTTPVKTPYHGKYNGQKEATGSRMYMDKEADRGSNADYGDPSSLSYTGGQRWPRPY